MLKTIRATIGEMNFAARRQQTPAPAGGGMVRAAWFPRFRPEDLPVFDRVVQSWDTANKPSELADYSACTTWGVKGSRLYPSRGHALEAFVRSGSAPPVANSR
jgi:phage terminase large subunit-like protein